MIVDLLSHLQLDAPLSYLVAFLVPAFDAIFPVLPSETTIVALGVATANTFDPRVAALVLLAAGGAFVGDSAPSHNAGMSATSSLGFVGDSIHRSSAPWQAATVASVSQMSIKRTFQRPGTAALKKARVP
jgi:hypothetical protein